MTNINELSPDVADAYREWAMGDDDASVDTFIHDECVVDISTGKFILPKDAVQVNDGWVHEDRSFDYLSDEEQEEIRQANRYDDNRGNFDND